MSPRAADGQAAHVLRAHIAGRARSESRRVESAVAARVAGVFANSKSRIFGRPSHVLSGFRSRCTMPASCAAAKRSRSAPPPRSSFVAPVLRRAAVISQNAALFRPQVGSVRDRGATRGGRHGRVYGARDARLGAIWRGRFCRRRQLSHAEAAVRTASTGAALNHSNITASGFEAASRQSASSGNERANLRPPAAANV